MRAFLNTIPAYFNTPIWITEIAIHVGYDDWDFVPSSRIVPVGVYHWDKMSTYINEVLDWLEDNAESYNIDKWFFFTTWQDIVTPPASDPYMGIIFFDGPDEDAQLNCLGELYRARSLGLPTIACNAEGTSIPSP
jgi:hypothetical protein